MKEILILKSLLELFKYLKNPRFRQNLLDNCISVIETELNSSKNNILGELTELEKNLIVLGKQYKCGQYELICNSLDIIKTLKSKIL